MTSCTGWAKKVIGLYLSYITLHCTRGITFLAHPVDRLIIV